MKVFISLVLLITLIASSLCFNYAVFNFFAALLIILDLDLYYLTKNKYVKYQNRLHSLIIYFVYPLILMHMLVCHIFSEVIDYTCLTPILLELTIAFIITKIIVKKDQIKTKEIKYDLTNLILIALILFSAVRVIVMMPTPILEYIVFLYLIVYLILKNRINEKEKLIMTAIISFISLITLNFITPVILFLHLKKD